MSPPIVKLTDLLRREGTYSCGEPWICEPCDAVNDDIRQLCRFCKKQRASRNSLTQEPQ